MRRFRNPRYAPEFLEKKLSPVGISPGLATVAFVVAPASATVVTDPTETVPPDVNPDDGLPPIEILPVVTGPAGPA